MKRSHTVSREIRRTRTSASTRKRPIAKSRVRKIFEQLGNAIPDPEVELTSSNPLELLIATILSAQCTDERVNTVTPALFARYHTALEYAEAEPRELEALIRSTGFYKSKAKNIIACASLIATRFHGRIPDNMEDLTGLPGVGRKTANVVLGSYFGQPAIVVDTHVKRVANRLQLTESDDPTTIEYDLQNVLPKAQWTIGAQRLLLHGRYVCQARVPKCEHCVIYTMCAWDGKFVIA
ncbi:MAG: endonuclease III [Nitrospirales bacterium]|nr:MAG: endonuclease III [Nitrospirales bacterium]